MPSVIELHDSVVQSCTESDGDIVIRLSPAYLHRATGLPGREAGDVFTLDLHLTFRDATITHPFVELPTELQNGSLKIGEKSFDNGIPYPLDVMAITTLDLIDFYGRAVRISAFGLTLAAASEETYLESFPGTDA